MNKHLSILLVLLLAGRILAPAAPPTPVTLAVLPFDAAEEKLQGKGAELASLLGALLSTNVSLWLVERAELDKLLSEHTLKLSGLTDPATAAQAGKMIGARVLVTGRVVLNGDSVILVAKIMSTETSRVFGETVNATSLDAMEKPVAELSEKIGKLIAKEQKTFVPPVISRENRIAKLRAALQGKPLPSIQINITEQALRLATIDPAVETEFGKIIKELDGEIVDAKQSGKPAAISIRGEAFSETGVRRGQLISSRARVEIKVTRQADGKVLAVDRESSVAVDIADAIAGKTALQNAALILAERVLPKVVAP